MSKKKDNSRDQFESVENALSKTEHYIEENQKSLTIIVFAIIIIVGGYLGYKRLLVSPKENEAQSQMWMAEKYFERDSFNLALNGDGNYLGFLDIIEEYSITQSANLANYYAGLSYLHLGQFEEAIEYLKKFDAKDQMISPIAYGAIADAYIELNNTDEAEVFYKKAINISENNFTTPIYLMKLGMLYEQQGDFKNALENYKRIEKDYPTSAEGRQVSKYIARVEVKVE